MDKGTMRRPPLWMRPGLAAMGALSLGGKLFACGAGLAVLSAWLLAEAGQGLTSDIDFVQAERRGAALTLPFRQVLSHLSADARAPEASSAVESDLGRLGATLEEAARIDPALRAVADRFADARTRWTAAGAPGDEPARRDQALVDELVGLQEAVADATLLTLDPELSSYYLMDVAVFRAPAIAQHLQSLRSDLRAVEPGGGGDATARVDLAQRAGVLGLHLQRLAEAVARVRGADAESGQAVGSAADPLIAAARGAIETMQAQVLLRPPTGADLERTDAGLAAAVQPAWETFDTAAAQLDRLLARRESSLLAQRNVLCIAAVLVMLLVGYLLAAAVRSVRGDVAALASFSRDLAEGRFPEHAAVSGRDEMRTVAGLLERVSGELRRRIGQEREAANVNARIRTALDLASTPVMVADRDGLVVYANGAMRRTLAQAAQPLRAACPRIYPRAPEGAPIAALRALDPDAAPESADASYATLRFGRFTFSLVFNAVVDPDGARVGTVVEWRDRTREEEIELEVDRIVSAAARGVLDGRIAVDGKVGFFERHSRNLNRLLEATVAGLSEIEAVMTSLAAGDLTRRVEGDYDGNFGRLKAAANRSIDQLAEIVDGIKSAVASVDGGAREIASGNADLARRTEAQAAAIEQTASALASVTEAAAGNTLRARDADVLAAEARGVAGRGGELMHHVVDGMGEIADASRRIGDVVESIDGIAFQTNLLALNAAVEAARAGPEGRGFAVVAAEIRTLALRAAEAAREIKRLAGQSRARVADGAANVERAGETMQEIVDRIGTVSGLMTEIARASAEQDGAIRQVGDAMVQMDRSTQQNAALVEEAAAAAQAMEEQSRRLLASTAHFRSGQSARPAAAA